MPLGKYKDFAACHGAKMREGLSSAAADRYCGALQAQIEGASSIKPKFGEMFGMSSQQFGQFPPKKDGEEKPKEESADITMSQQDGSTLAAFIMNADTAFQTGEVTPELQAQLEDAKAVIQKVMNVVPEGEGEAAPPA